MFANLTGWHALIVLAIVLLVFGATKLPGLARSLGQSVRILKEESKNDEPEPGTIAVPVVAGPATRTDVPRAS